MSLLIKLFRVLQSPDEPAPGGSPPVTPPATPPPAATPPAASATPPDAVWPDDWRTQIAGDNAESLKTLERFTSPKAMYESYASLRQKMSSGELKPNTQFPEKGTPEEQNAWRQANGLPESPEKYDLTLKDGLVIGEEDKPVIDDFLKAAHAAHTPPGAVKAAVQWYFNTVKQQQEAQAESDRQDKQANDDALRSEWGNEYRPNLNRIHGLLDTAPQGVKDELLGGRLANGKAIGNSPEVLRWLASLAIQINPATTLVPGVPNTEVAITDEIAKLEGLMSNRGSEYWTGPNAEKNQKRYRDLITARDRHKSA